MRLCTILSGGKPAVGVKLGDGKIVDLSKQMPRGPKSVVEILAGGKKVQQAVLKACAKPKAGATVSEKSAKYLPPIPAPGKILCIGLNYRKHAEETGSPIPQYPVVFTRFNNTLVPHKGKMLATTHSKEFDWEAELTSRDRQEVPQRAEGEGALGDRGLCLLQRRLDPRLAAQVGRTVHPGQELRRHRRLRPRHRDPDELPKGAAPLRIMTRVNGVTMQDSSTDDLIFDVPTLVHELSKCMTLDPGDIIITGTPSGVAMARKPQPWLKPGDVCEVEIEGIGILSNTIAQGG